MPFWGSCSFETPLPIFHKWVRSISSMSRPHVQNLAAACNPLEGGVAAHAPLGVYLLFRINVAGGVALQYSRCHLLSVDEFRNIADRLAVWKVCGHVSDYCSLFYDTQEDIRSVKLVLEHETSAEMEKSELVNLLSPECRRGARHER